MLKVSLATISVLFSTAAFGFQSRSSTYVQPAVGFNLGYLFNDQIGSGPYIGAIVGIELERCRYSSRMVSRQGSRLFASCTGAAKMGPFFDIQGSEFGYGYATGLYIGNLFASSQLKYSRFEAKDGSPYLSSDRGVIALRFLLTTVEIGLKKNDGEDFYIPSLGLALGL
jgi:hypothetical protein